MTLADEILLALPGALVTEPKGATVVVMAQTVAARAIDVRAAMHALHADGRAIFMRYPTSRLMHLLPIDHAFGGRLAVCGNCRVLFERPKDSKRLNCSRFCAQQATWDSPKTRARRSAAIRAAKAAPGSSGRQSERNLKAWAESPDRRAKVSQRNRERWADPATKARLSAAIQAANGAPEARHHASEVRKALWADPEYRERAAAGIRRSKNTPEAKAKFAQLLRDRWQDPVLREKYMAATRIGRAAAAEANRGRKQSSSQVEKRILATLETKARKAASQETIHRTTLEVTI